MAVDTVGKRYSLIQLGRQASIMLPVPDGDLANIVDRKHLLYLYATEYAAEPDTDTSDRSGSRYRRRVSDSSSYRRHASNSSVYRRSPAP